MRHKVNLKKVRAITIDTLGLHTNPLNNLLDLFFRHKKEERQTDAKAYREGYTWRHGHKKRKQATIAAAKKVSVGDVIDMWDSMVTGPSAEMRSSPFMKYFVTKLVELGLTRFDWVRLPQSTIEGLSLTKEQWLDQRALLLDTLSYSALDTVIDALIYEQERDGGEVLSRDITIRELLSCKGSELAYEWERHQRSFDKTRRKLRTLGFNQNDGPFMVQPTSSFVTKQDWVTKVVNTCRLSKRQAEIVVDAVHALRWGPSSGPVEWDAE